MPFFGVSTNFGDGAGGAGFVSLGAGLGASAGAALLSTGVGSSRVARSSSGSAITPMVVPTLISLAPSCFCFAKHC